MTDSNLSEITRIPSSDVRRVGWRGVMVRVAREGRVLVTNHREPEAVILSITEYTALASAASAAAAACAQQSALDALRRSFDERLAALREPGAADQLRALINDPTKLDGLVKAGSGH
jgi:prevent-host-death family protein